MKVSMKTLFLGAPKLFLRSGSMFMCASYFLWSQRFTLSWEGARQNLFIIKVILIFHVG